MKKSIFVLIISMALSFILTVIAFIFMATAGGKINDTEIMLKAPVTHKVNSEIPRKYTYSLITELDMVKNGQTVKYELSDIEQESVNIYILDSNGDSNGDHVSYDDYDVYKEPGENIHGYEIASISAFEGQSFEVRINSDTQTEFYVIQEYINLSDIYATIILVVIIVLLNTVSFVSFIIAVTLAIKKKRKVELDANTEEEAIDLRKY